MNVSGHLSSVNRLTPVKCPTLCIWPTSQRNTVRMSRRTEGHLIIQFNPGLIKCQLSKNIDQNCIYSQILIFKTVGLLCASRSRLVGDKGSVHWRTIAKNNLLYSNIIIIKQTAWFSDDTRMTEDGRFFFSFSVFWFASTWYRLRCNLLNLLTGGFEVSKSKRG